MKLNLVMYFVVGMGIWMWFLIVNCFKLLVNVVGKLLIDYVIQFGQNVGLMNVVVNVYYLVDMVEKYVFQGVCVFDEWGGLLDMGGGLKVVLLLLIGDIVFIMNMDVVWKGDNLF